MTITEVVVSLAILACLAALLVPAIQSVRESNRRTLCGSHLHQLSVALESHVGLQHRYPGGLEWREALLPFLEFRPLVRAIQSNDLSVSLTNQSLPVFHCPSDGGIVDSMSQANYFANYGTGLQTFGYNGFFSPRPRDLDLVGAWKTPHRYGPTRPQDIHRGLSHTAALSEVLVADPAGRATDHRRAVWSLNDHDELLMLPEKLELAKQICLAEPLPNAAPDGASRGWSVLGDWSNVDVTRVVPLSPLSWGYDHTLPPNSRACFTGGSRFGLLPPASSHAGGVQVLMGDGHVTFTSNAIDPGVWAVCGTRSHRSSISSVP